MKILEGCKIPSLKRLQRGKLLQEVKDAFKEDDVWKEEAPVGHIVVWTEGTSQVAASVIEALPDWCQDATCALVTDYAWPHTDMYWKNKYIFTLVLEGDHQLFDTRCSTIESSAIKGGRRVFNNHTVPGSVFVVDPAVTHWLKPVNPAKESIFVSLQWEIEKKKAADFARKLHGLSQGTLACEDPRYTRWFK